MDLKMEWPDECYLDEYAADNRSGQPASWKERLYDDDLYFDEELSALLQLQEISSAGENYY